MAAEKSMVSPFATEYCCGCSVSRALSSTSYSVTDTPAALAAFSKGSQGRLARVLNCWPKRGVSKKRLNPKSGSAGSGDFLALAIGERESTLVLAGTNAERLALTQTIRAGLQDQGSLGVNRFVMQSLRGQDLTTAQASYLKTFAVGDVLVPIQDYRKQGLIRGGTVSGDRGE